MIKRINFQQQQLIITIFMIFLSVMCIVRMFSNLKQLMKKYTPKLVFVHTAEPLNFYNYFAKTTIFKVKILLEINQMVLKSLTLLILQLKK